MEIEVERKRMKSGCVGEWNEVNIGKKWFFEVVWGVLKRGAKVNFLEWNVVRVWK